MPWQPNGTFVRQNTDFQGSNVWQQDQQAKIKIIASRHDFHDQDIALGIADCLNLDGLNAMREDLDMGNNKIINLQPSTGEGQIATFDQLIDSGTFNNGTRELTLHAPIGDIPPITIPAGDTTSTTGQWTPQITGATMGGVNGGYWQKDGRLVNLFCLASWVSRTSSTNQINITGLPFNIAPAYPGADLGMYAATWLAGAGINVSGIGSGGWYVRDTSNNVNRIWNPEACLQAVHPKNSTTLELSTYFGVNNTAVNGYGNLVTDTLMQDMQPTGRLGFQMQYFTDD
jgi:hypothetical protein